ncbi:hypothetical protein PHET_08679 [Paragonimus heterotremus]|uniref:GATOR2 complex protein WDR24 n=1 Tax=Paragonimus heterotremus TaxID=100268 RepID=A0A8J4TBC5_9TREM|nr:hypothetical protein PHET_08679 [Paragonimus heterotremus]
MFLLPHSFQDTREPNPSSNPRIFIQRSTLPSPVRDVVYSPLNSYLFAAAQENGTVSVWDTRQQGRPYWAFQGHSCSIATLDWHPNWLGGGRNWLATAGSGDHLIKVWSFNQVAPGQSRCPLVIYTVRTSYVSRVRWRPGFVTQLVSSCNQTFDLSAYLWDLRRPYLPYAAFEEHTGIVTSISWSPSETDYFYTVGRDGLLIRHCVADGLRPAESASPVALSFSARGQLAHAVSRDRVLASQPPPYVDETNLVTQSPFYRALRSSNSLLSGNSNLSSTQLGEGPPGFYAAPSADVPGPLGSLPSNLPPMGSTQSAELFVTQAQSLLYQFEPSIVFLRHADWLNCNTALVPDLIIALAKHYKFVGPSVDRVFAHNAAVALRFGQSFLMQFWSLLRSIYGSVPNTSDRRKLSANSTSGGTKPVLDSEDPASDAPPTQKAVANSPITHTSNALCPITTQTTELRNTRVVQSGLRLRDLLLAIGVESCVDLPSASSTVLPDGTNGTCASLDVPSATTLDLSKNAQLTADSLPFTMEVSTLGPMQDAVTVAKRPDISQLAVDDSVEPDDTAAISSTIPIGDGVGGGRCLNGTRRRGNSSSKLSRSPSSTYVTPHGLAMSASSAHTCDSLGEPVDFLFHFPQQPTIIDEASQDVTITKPVGSKNLVDEENNPTGKNLDLICAFGAPDDPVLLESTFLPDEAFEIRHPIDQRHVLTSMDSRDVSQRETKVTHSIQLTDRWSSKTRSNKSKSRTRRSAETIGRSNGKQKKPTVTPKVTDQTRLSSANSPSDRSVHLLAPFSTSFGPTRHIVDPSVLTGLGTVHLPDATPLIVWWFQELVEIGHVQTVCTALLALGPERLRLTEWITEARIESWFTAYLELLSRFRLWTVCARIIRQCGNSKGGVDNVQCSKETRRAMTMQGATRPLLTRPSGELQLDPRKMGYGGIITNSKSDGLTRTRWESGSGTPGISSVAGSLTSSGAPNPATRALAPDVSTMNQASTTLVIHCGRCSKRLVAKEATQRITGHAGWACSRHTSTAETANASCALCHLTVRGLFVWCRGCSHGGHLEHMQVITSPKRVLIHPHLQASNNPWFLILLGSSFSGYFCRF